MRYTDKTRLIVVRHAQSEGNIGGFLTGQCNVLLTSEGHRQAQETAKSLEGTQIDVAYSSDLVRVRQTLSYITEPRGLEIHMKKGLREQNFGLWENLMREEIKRKYYNELLAWLEDSAHNYASGGENMKDLFTRVDRAFDEIVDESRHKNVLVGTHATPIRVMRVKWHGMPFEAVNETGWPMNSGVTVIDYFDDGKIEIVSEPKIDNMARDKFLGCGKVKMI